MATKEDILGIISEYKNGFKKEIEIYENLVKEFKERVLELEKEGKEITPKYYHDGPVEFEDGRIGNGPGYYEKQLYHYCHSLDMLEMMDRDIERLNKHREWAQNYYNVPAVTTCIDSTYKLNENNA